MNGKPSEDGCLIAVVFVIIVFAVVLFAEYGVGNA